MKILQIMAGAEQGGAETAFVDICKALHDAGAQQHVLTRANDLRVAQLRDVGLPVTTLPFGGALDFYTPFQISRIQSEFKPHIVQSWMSRASSKVPKSKAGQFLNVARLGGYYNLKYYKKIDYFVANTPLIKEYLVEKGIERTRCTHINNFAATEISQNKINRESLNTPHNAFVCLSLARYHKAKALDVLIKAIEPLLNVHLWLAGEGIERENLQALARSLNVESRVHFLGWRSDRTELLQASDLCVFPSRFEPFGTVFVQAWAAKTPVVASNSDGPKQFMRNEQDGLIFEIDNVEQCRAAIMRMMNDEALRVRCAQNGYARYTQEFTKEICAENYLNFYAEILRRESISL